MAEPNRGPQTHGCIAQNPGGVCGEHGRHEPCQRLPPLPIPPLHLPGLSAPSPPLHQLPPLPEALSPLASAR